MSIKDILSPFYVWKRAFEKPLTTRKPLTERPGAARYRGFHQNDMQKCIGCGTCEAICQNAAIDMVPVEGIETTKADSGLRPKIDYGRCCWCGLCVDICTTGSLTMSNEYVWIDTDPDVFRFVPGAETKPWDTNKLGYRRQDGYELLNRQRVDMEQLSPEQSITSFAEMVQGYSRQQAITEATRCVECGLCVASCPAHMDIPEYIRAIREDNLEEALQLLYKTNPMPNTCGRICTHRCEEVCSIGVLGDPIAIRWLKRYIIDQVDASRYSEILAQEFASNGKKVAIIGGGPGGLSAAYYLQTMGYSVTIYEANPAAGGMIRYGVPEYRMPYNQLDKDIDYIRSLGVEIKLDARVGKDADFMQLYDNYDAVFFSTGLTVPYKMEIPGEDLPGVVSGLEVLDKVTRNIDPLLGKSVAVIGGGNVAMDAARTALRYGAEVYLIYRRREEDMPADAEEIHEAHAEGVQFITQAIPIDVERTNQDTLRFSWNNAQMVEQPGGGRPRPVAIDGDIAHLDVDTVISAIGQGGDYSFLPADISDKLNFHRYKVVTSEHGQTGDPKIFAGGDIVNKTADAISAIADGHQAAIGIDRFLRSK
jgi:glutamate synthase (NADPH/NADH) small chain